MAWCSDGPSMDRARRARHTRHVFYPCRRIISVCLTGVEIPNDKVIGAASEAQEFCGADSIRYEETGVLYDMSAIY
jgi:hypothetical protein